MESKVKKFIKNPGLLFLSLGHREFFNWMSDEKYLKMIYRISLGKKLNLENPRLYNEKLQWLKLNDRNPLYTKLVDKYEVREYIQQTIGGEYLIPLVGGPWSSFDEIDFDALPDQFVLKCTHDSGGLVICKNKADLDIVKARRKIEGCLKHSFYWGMREWPYKDVQPRIIAEAYMEDPVSHDLKDYKFLSFNGRTKAMYIASDRQLKEETKFDFFDMEFHHLDFRNGHPNAKVIPAKPECFAEMHRLADLLSVGIPQVRVDFYEINGRVYFGEMTFFHMSGLTPFEPEEWDERFGDWIELPQRK